MNPPFRIPNYRGSQRTEDWLSGLDPFNQAPVPSLDESTVSHRSPIPIQSSTLPSIENESTPSARSPSARKRKRHPGGPGLTREHKMIAMRIAWQQGKHYGRCSDKVFWTEVSKEFKQKTGIEHMSLSRPLVAAAEAWVEGGSGANGEQGFEDSYDQALRLWAEVWRRRHDKAVAAAKAKGDRDRDAEITESRTWRESQTLRARERDRALSIDQESDPEQEESSRSFTSSIPSSRYVRPTAKRRRRGDTVDSLTEADERFLTSFNQLVDGVISINAPKKDAAIEKDVEMVVEKVVEKAVEKVVKKAVEEAFDGLQNQISQLLSLVKERKEKDEKSNI